MKKTVLITGASRGIGRAAARLFAREGYAVAIHYNQSEAEAFRLKEELSAQGHTAITVQADVSCRDQVFAMVDKTLQYFSQIDILVCNAGIAHQKLFTDITPREWRNFFAVNLDGMFHCCQAVLPSMLHRKAGKIITLSSMWGLTGASCEVAYSATKAAVIGLTRALAKELGPSGITVNSVAPGVIDTDMNRNLDEASIEALKEETPLGVLGTPEDIAASILFLASPGADFITGQVLSPNGGFII
ncbi:MAG: SDR family oxidoreductase [Oscillospiraceae bacterium]|nr:SDR family oxidoreductase [Oscillospiraceae bacterium]